MPSATAGWDSGETSAPKWSQLATVVCRCAGLWLQDTLKLGAGTLMDPDGPWDTQSISNGQLSLSQNVSMQCSSALNHEMIQLSITRWYFHYSVLFWLSTCWHLNHGILQPPQFPAFLAMMPMSRRKLGKSIASSKAESVRQALQSSAQSFLTFSDQNTWNKGSLRIQINPSISPRVNIQPDTTK